MTLVAWGQGGSEGGHGGAAFGKGLKEGMWPTLMQPGAELAMPPCPQRHSARGLPVAPHRLARAGAAADARIIRLISRSRRPAGAARGDAAPDELFNCWAETGDGSCWWTTRPPPRPYCAAHRFHPARLRPHPGRGAAWVYAQRASRGVTTPGSPPSCRTLMPNCCSWFAGGARPAAARDGGLIVPAHRGQQRTRRCWPATVHPQSASASPHRRPGGAGASWPRWRGSCRTEVSRPESAVAAGRQNASAGQRAQYRAALLAHRQLQATAAAAGPRDASWEQCRSPSTRTGAVAG